jgi:hypothetical protein
MADLSFETGNDTDINELDSVQPIALGEDANPLNWNRPTDNIRIRTERLRVGVNENAYLHDEMAGFTLGASSGTTVQWDGSWDGVSPAPAKGVSGSGYFELSADIFLFPLMAPGVVSAARAAELFWGAGPGYASILSWADIDDGAANNLRVVSKIYSHEGGDWVDFEVIQATTNLTSPIIEVFGEPPVTGGGGFAPRKAHVRVTISDESVDTNTIDDVIAAISADGTAGPILSLNYHPTLTETGTDPMFTVPKTRLTRRLSIWSRVEARLLRKALRPSRLVRSSICRMSRKRRAGRCHFVVCSTARCTGSTASSSRSTSPASRSRRSSLDLRTSRCPSGCSPTRR